MSPMPLTPDCTAPPSLLMTTPVPTPTPAPNPFAILQFQPSTSQKVPPQNCDSSANCTAKNGYSNCLVIQTREILDVVQESYCSFTSGPVVGSNGTSNGGETACNNELCYPEHTKNVVYNSPSNVFTMVQWIATATVIIDGLQCEIICRTAIVAIILCHWPSACKVQQRSQPVYEKYSCY